MADLAYDAVRRMSRRRFLTTTALGTAAVAGGSLLAGCGGGRVPARPAAARAVVGCPGR